MWTKKAYRKALPGFTMTPSSPVPRTIHCVIPTLSPPSIFALCKSTATLFPAASSSPLRWHSFCVYAILTLPISASPLHSYHYSLSLCLSFFLSLTHSLAFKLAVIYFLLIFLYLFCMVTKVLFSIQSIWVSGLFNTLRKSKDRL